MPALQSIPADNIGDEIIFFEVTESGDDVAFRTEEASAIGGGPNAPQTFQEAVARLKPALQCLTEALSDYAVGEIQIEFGLKFSGKVGFVFTSSTGEVNFKVAMKVVRGAPKI